MKRLVIPNHAKRDDYSDDVDRIMMVCAQRGYLISPEVARWAWNEESDMMAAGWLFLPNDDQQLFDIVRYKLVVQDE